MNKEECARKDERKKENLNLHCKFHSLHLMKKLHNKSLIESLCADEGSDAPGYDAHSPLNPSGWVVMETWEAKSNYGVLAMMEELFQLLLQDQK